MARAGGAVASDPGFPAAADSRASSPTSALSRGGSTRCGPRNRPPPAAQHGAAAGDLQLTRQVEHQWRLTGRRRPNADAHHRQVRAIETQAGPARRRATGRRRGLTKLARSPRAARIQARACLPRASTTAMIRPCTSPISDKCRPASARAAAAIAATRAGSASSRPGPASRRRSGGRRRRRSIGARSRRFSPSAD